MAYERTWFSIAPQGPRTASSVTDAAQYWLWIVKQFLTGGLGGVANGGQWAMWASCDGTVAGTAGDGVDRWGSTFDAAKVVVVGAAGAHSWAILTKTITPAAGGQPVQLWLLLEARGSRVYGGSPTTGLIYAALCATAPSALTTTTMTLVNILGDSSSSFGAALSTWAADTANGRRFYGAVTTTGDFWLAQTDQGEVAAAMAFQNPAGCHSNDQYPFWFHECIATNTGTSSASYPFAGVGLVSMGNPENGTVLRNGKRYNGASGGTYLTTVANISALDEAISAPDGAPCWVKAGNSPTAQTTQHNRGRLVDIGAMMLSNLNTAPSTMRQCNVGQSFDDPAVPGSPLYVAVNSLILPYTYTLV